jgi:N-acetylglucosamine kinase-like BadF-type ATPase
LKHVNAENVDILLEQYIEGKIEPSAINALAKVLMASAEAGDGVSVEIVRSFGTRLGSYIAAGLRKYDMSEIELDVVLSGGIFKSGSKGLFDSINKAIASVSSKASLVYSPYEPILGALLAGLEELSGPLNRRVLDTVRNEGKALGLSIDLLS